MIYFVICNGLIINTVISYLRCVFTDPGRIEEGMKAPYVSGQMKIENCEKCVGKETWKPERAHHCRECGYCIFKMDHHCPWINNCVGQRNMKFFMLFNFYTFLSSLMLVYCMIMSFVNLLCDRRRRYHTSNPVS